MTYTNGYQSPNTAGQSAYSPFNRTAQQPTQQPGQYAGYPTAVPGENPFPNAQQPGSTLGSDTYLAPSSPEEIDNLSGNIDSKIAEIRRAFSQPTQPQPVQMAPGTPTPAGMPNPMVSQEEMNWALELENKVKTQNYQPNAQETARYEQIFAKLQAAQNAPPASAPSAAPAAPTQPASQVSDAEISWALQLEQKVNQGYQPNAQETAQYNSIFQRINTAPPAGNPQAPAGAPAPSAPPVSQEEMNWALELENKVKTQNYQPTAEETARYEQIFAKLQAAQNAQGAPAPAPTQTAPRNWSQWSQPFNVPAAPTMPLPIAGPGGQPVMNVPSSLNGAPQTPPSAVLNQAPGQPAAQAMAPAAAPSQAEIDWALQLEAKVNQGHQPTAQETAQYQDIARRLQAAQSGAAAPAPQAPAPQAAPQQSAPPLPPGVSQAEIDWALQLEAKVNQGHQPTAQETAQYQQIAQKLQAAQNAVAAGQQQPAPQQVPTAPPPAAAPAPAPAQQGLPNGISQQEIQWAMELEAKVNQQNYQPTQQEVQRHADIAQRLQAAQSAPQQAPAPAPQFNPNAGGVQNVVPQGPQNIPIMPQSYPQVQAQTQSPGFMDRLGNAWNALWE